MPLNNYRKSVRGKQPFKKAKFEITVRKQRDKAVKSAIITIKY